MKVTALILVPIMHTVDLCQMSPLNKTNTKERMNHQPHPGDII